MLQVSKNAFNFLNIANRSSKIHFFDMFYRNYPILMFFLYVFLNENAKSEPPCFCCIYPNACFDVSSPSHDLIGFPLAQRDPLLRLGSFFSDRLVSLPLASFFGSIDELPAGLLFWIYRSVSRSPPFLDKLIRVFFN